MNFIRKFVLFIIGILGLFGLNWFFNPSIDDTKEYWDRHEELDESQLKTEEILERIDKKKDKE